MATTSPTTETFVDVVDMAPTSARVRFDMPEESPQSLEKHCLVTVGATVGFRPLVDEVLHPDFLLALKSLGYTQLYVQCGPDKDHGGSLVAALPPPEQYSGKPFKIFVLGYTQDMMAYMRSCASKEGARAEGLVICHAGSGSILDAMSVGAAIIAVPNPALQDNHQVEIALALEKRGLLTYGRVRFVLETLYKHHALLNMRPIGAEPALKTKGSEQSGLTDFVKGAVDVNAGMQAEVPGQPEARHPVADGTLTAGVFCFVLLAGWGLFSIIGSILSAVRQKGEPGYSNPVDI